MCDRIEPPGVQEFDRALGLIGRVIHYLDVNLTKVFVASPDSFGAGFWFHLQIDMDVVLLTGIVAKGHRSGGREKVKRIAEMPAVSGETPCVRRFPYTSGRLFRVTLLGLPTADRASFGEDIVSPPHMWEFQSCG